MSERTELLKVIQAHDFALNETALFLDTHPQNKKALLYYDKIRKLLAQVTVEYETKYGPLTRMSATSTERWQWIDSPWPWEMED